MPTSPLMDVDNQPQHQATLLIVDDNAANRDLLSRRLARQGYALATAEDGEAALSRLEQQDIDLVLLDIMMPGISGIEVLEQIKANQTTQHLPVIMISALDEIQTVTRCLELGADDYLTKPFEPAILKARVSASLAKKQIQDQQRIYLSRIQQQNTVLEEKIYKQGVDIYSAKTATIFAISKLAESRDPETGAHLERLREYSKVLAEALIGLGHYTAQIDTAFIESLYTASPLHDIGKVGTPDPVLLKPGKLDHDEFEIMKQHTVIGANTLRAVARHFPGNPFIEMGIEIAESHHEKWDGSGYPHGLKGEEIPLSARILAVADVYDALSNERCYKKAFSHEKSLGIIRQTRGQHFDPQIIDAMETCTEEFIKIKAFYNEAS